MKIAIYKNQGNTRNLLSLLYFANCLPLPTIALLSTHIHSMLMAIHAFTFPSFPTQSKRWTSSSLRSHESPTSEAFEWQGDSRQVLHAYQMSDVACPAIPAICFPCIYTASEPRTWRQDAMALRLHVVAIPRDDQGTLLNISHNTFVESKFLVRSRKFTQNPPHWRSRLSTLGEHWCHMTWSRLLGGTWVLIWWIWELTESTQQKPLSKCNCLLCMVLPNAASQSIVSIAVHPIGPSMPCG